MNLTPQQSKKSQRLLRIIGGGDNAVKDFILEIDDRLDEILQSTDEDVTTLEEKIKSIQEEVEELRAGLGKEITLDAQLEKVAMKVAVKLVDVQKGDPGPPGPGYIISEKDKMDIAQRVKVPIVEKVIEKTEIIREQPIFKTETIEKVVKESAETGETIVNKVNDLEITPDKQIDFSHIKNWKKVIKDEIKTSRGNVIMGGTAGRDLFKDIDISASLDGVTKTFNIPAVWRIIAVDLSSYPYGSCRKNIDYTWTPTSITFTSQIDAASQLSTGQTCILTVVTG